MACNNTRECDSRPEPTRLEERAATETKMAGNPSNTLQAGDSFFRLDRPFGLKRDYDKSDKVLPPSQSEKTNLLDQTKVKKDVHQCFNCERILKSAGGLKMHQRKCLENSSSFSQTKNSNCFKKDTIALSSKLYEK